MATQVETWVARLQAHAVTRRAEASAIWKAGLAIVRPTMDKPDKRSAGDHTLDSAMKAAVAAFNRAYDIVLEQQAEASREANRIARVALSISKSETAMHTMVSMFRDNRPVTGTSAAGLATRGLAWGHDGCGRQRQYRLNDEGLALAAMMTETKLTTLTRGSTVEPRETS